MKHLEPAAPARPIAPLLAAAAAVLYLALSLPQAQRPFLGDEVDFVKLARALVERGSHQYDRGFIDDVTETGAIQTWTYHPPLYMWALGLSFRLFGGSEPAARGLGIFCGLVSLALTFLIARAVCGRSPHRDVVAAAAVALCAINPFFLQSSLLVDIDGTVYTVLLLLFVYGALRLEEARELPRAAALATIFIACLWAKMTTAIAFPVVLAVYDVARGRRSRAAFDVLVVGACGVSLFLALYAWYASAMGLDFASLFVHLGRSRPGKAALVLKSFVWFAPVLPLLVKRLRGPTRVGLVVAMIACAGGVALVERYRSLASEAAVSLWLIVAPFCSPLLLLLLYGVFAQGLTRWRRAGADPIDLPLASCVAIFISYAGVTTRGPTFSYYQAPAMPLLAVVVAHFLLADGTTFWRERRARILSVVAVAGAIAYGYFVLGDSYFLSKRQPPASPGSDLFAVLASPWIGGASPGNQSVPLGVLWYLLTALPVAAVAFAAGRAPAGSRWMHAGAVAAGLTLALSIKQAQAGYQTNINYGHPVEPTREMVRFLNQQEIIRGYFLAGREFSHYVAAGQFIDMTRYTGGYRHRTRPALSQKGELTFEVDDGGGPPDELPRGPIHFAIGDYPLLDQAGTYEVLKEVGGLKLYRFRGARGSVPPSTASPRRFVVDRAAPRRSPAIVSSYRLASVRRRSAW
ncbi:MAG: glycosyltransferase family 39 protein [Myxococcales bacterium]|nr:glycosyltransferase family 39 protein [Myxococcales bacterium]